MLCRTIQQGWPQHRAEVPDVARPYFDFRDQMTTQDQLVFKGAAVVIPAALRYEMMVKCHATHIGIEGCLRRARECDVCLSHQNAQPKETLLQHEISPAMGEDRRRPMRPCTSSGAMARDPALSSVKWQGGERGQNSQASVYEMPRDTAVRIPSSPRLEEYTDRRVRIQSGTAFSGQEMPNPAANVGDPPTTSLRHLNR